MHTDDSDVTFNACLTSNFTGAGLTFCGDAGTSRHRKLAFRYRHEMGRVVVHLGTKRHGADDIESGERRNLIIWNHNLHFIGYLIHQNLSNLCRRQCIYNKANGIF